MMDLLANPELWKYLSIPVIAALIGWITNWMAIKLTFYPLDFVGIRPFLGWQGIIPPRPRRWPPLPWTQPSPRSAPSRKSSNTLIRAC